MIHMNDAKKMGLKPQDVLISLYLLTIETDDFKLIDIAKDLEISLSEVSQGLERLKRSHLLSEDKKRVNRKSLLEFLTFGLKYVYPVEPGPLKIGFATSHSYGELKKQIKSGKLDQYVWPDLNGNLKGQSITPLFKSVTKAIQKNAMLYELLALTDALRVGRSRELKIASDLLRKKIINEKTK